MGLEVTLSPPDPSPPLLRLTANISLSRLRAWGRNTATAALIYGGTEPITSHLFRYLFANRLCNNIFTVLCTRQ